MYNHDDICKSLAGKYSFLTKSLVEKQLKLLGDENSRHFDLCMKKNQIMIEQNDTFKRSENSITEEINRVNFSIAKKEKYVKNNDLIVAESIDA